MGGYARYVIELPPELARGMGPLRVCRECGLVAFTEKELDLFRKASMAAYGRSTICKECSNRLRLEKTWRSKKAQEIIADFERPIMCYFCREEVKKPRGVDSDSLLIHSIDGNHDNWNKENKVPAHRRCHGSHHNLGDKSPLWKGDEATYGAKWRREWENKRRKERGLFN